MEKAKFVTVGRIKMKMTASKKQTQVVDANGVREQGCVKSE